MAEVEAPAAVDLTVAPDESAVVAVNLETEDADDTPATSTALTTTNAEGKKVIKKTVKKKRRPARPQVDPSTFKSEPPPQTGTIFNIW